MVLGITMGIVILVNQFPVVAFVRRLMRLKTPHVADADLPRFAVLMPVRGSDPFLGAALRGLAQQDYPQFEVHVIVDHDDDPSWETIRSTLTELQASHVFPVTLKNKRETCALICSALLQMLDQMSPNCELVALCPSDMVPPKNWLRLMGSSLADPTVGTTCGNRWYAPRIGYWGSLVRYLWNAAAVVPMWRHKLTWGGTMALRVHDINRANIREVWSRSMCEDVPVTKIIRELGLRTAMIPELMIVNEEEQHLPSCYRFIQRQTALTRMYHPSSFALINHYSPVAAAFFANAGMFAFGLWQNDLTLMAWSGGGILFAMTVLLICLGLLEWSIGSRIGSDRKWSLSLWFQRIAKLLVALPVTIAVYSVAVVSATFSKTIVWRGITYQVDSPFEIRMQGYQPFQPAKRDDHRLSV